MKGFRALVTGASGTGKEVVGEPLRKSRYLRSRQETAICDDAGVVFSNQHLGVSPTLLSPAVRPVGERIHGRGRDRKDCAETCTQFGLGVFAMTGTNGSPDPSETAGCDETRTVHPVGDTQPEFQGKLNRATKSGPGRPEFEAGIFAGSLLQGLCLGSDSDAGRWPSKTGRTAPRTFCAM